MKKSEILYSEIIDNRAIFTGFVFDKVWYSCYKIKIKLGYLVTFHVYFMSFIVRLNGFTV